MQTHTDTLCGSLYQQAYSLLQGPRLSFLPSFWPLLHYQEVCSDLPAFLDLCPPLSSSVTNTTHSALLLVTIFYTRSDLPHPVWSPQCPRSTQYSQRSGLAEQRSSQRRSTVINHGHLKSFRLCLFTPLQLKGLEGGGSVIPFPRQSD